MTRFTLLISLLAGCWTASLSPESKQPRLTDVRVELAAVTLGDDCGDDAILPPPVAQKSAPMEAPADAPASAAPCNPNAGTCGSHRYQRQCDQTSMQLSLRASDGDESTTVRVKQVELLDDNGRVLARLGSRSPTRWTTDGSYVAWDETIAPNQKLATSYMLAAPDWNKLTNGRWNAHSKTFQLRVTLAVGANNRTVDKQSIIPARLDPPVPDLIRLRSTIRQFGDNTCPERTPCCCSRRSRVAVPAKQIRRRTSRSSSRR